MLRQISLCIAIGLLGLLFTADASASIITFGTTPIDRLDQAGPQTEAGFTYKVQQGIGWEIQNIFGSPDAALATLFDDDNSVPDDSITFRRTNGGLFDFLSFDYSSVNAFASDKLRFIGTRDGSLVDTFDLTTTTANASTFAQISPMFSGEIDLLEIRVTELGQGATILDNLNLAVDSNPVPEPATVAIWIMLGLGLAGYKGVGHRQRKQSLSTGKNPVHTPE